MFIFATIAARITANASSPLLQAALSNCQLPICSDNIDRLTSLSSTIKILDPVTSIGTTFNVFSITQELSSKLNQKVDPSPTLLSTPIFPPINSTKAEDIAKPKPVPSYFLLAELST